MECLLQSQCRFILLSARQPGEVTSGAHSSCLKAGKYTKTFQLRQEVSLLEIGLYSHQALIHPFPQLAIPSSPWARATTLRMHCLRRGSVPPRPGLLWRIQPSSQEETFSHSPCSPSSSLRSSPELTKAESKHACRSAFLLPHFKTAATQRTKPQNQKLPYCCTLLHAHTPWEFPFSLSFGSMQISNQHYKMATTQHPLSDGHCVGTQMPDHYWRSPDYPVCSQWGFPSSVFKCHSTILPRVFSSPIHVNPHWYPQPHGCSGKAQNNLSVGQALFSSFGCSNLSLNSTEPSALFRAHVFACLKLNFIA